MNEELLRRTFEVRGRDFDKAGETASGVKSLLEEIGVDAGIVRRAGVVIFEAEMNVVMYAERATITFVLSEEDITIEVSDQGPGIPDIDQAMQEGFSTASDEMREMGFGFGMGLPNIKRNSDRFSIQTVVGQGTRVLSEIKLDSSDDADPRVSD